MSQENTDEKTTLLEELDVRQDEVNEALNELNDRIVDLIELWTQSEEPLQKAA